MHHVRAVHGSALNISGRSRRILFYEIAAADAWPLATFLPNYRDFEQFFKERMITGTPTPRAPHDICSGPHAWCGRSQGSIQSTIFSLPASATSRPLWKPAKWRQRPGPAGDNNAIWCRDDVTCAWLSGIGTPRKPSPSRRTRQWRSYSEIPVSSQARGGSAGNNKAWCRGAKWFIVSLASLMLGLSPVALGQAAYAAGPSKKARPKQCRNGAGHRCPVRRHPLFALTTICTGSSRRSYLWHVRPTAVSI